MQTTTQPADPKHTETCRRCGRTGPAHQFLIEHPGRIVTCLRGGCGPLPPTRPASLPALDNGWGLCPECNGEPEFIHVHKHHWATCPVHKVAWYVGSNLMTTYDRWDDAARVRYYGTTDIDRIAAGCQARLNRYAVVEPRFR